ncbi:MAG: ATP-binding protein [Bacteroidales bacterium]
MAEHWETYRQKIIGLGEDSFAKSYYPELQEKIRSLQELNRNFEIVFNSVQDLVFIHEPDGRVVIMNDMAKQTLRLDQRVPQEQNLLDFLRADHHEKATRDWMEALGGTSNKSHWIVRPMDRDEGIQVEATFSEANWSGRRVVVTVLRDIRKQLEYEDELIRAKQKAEENDRLKTAFIANISHEIRTPMNGIMGFAQLLSNPDLGREEITEYIQIIQQSGKRLLGIINDLIDISRIEAGEVELKPTDFRLRGEMEFLLHFFEPMVAGRDVRLNLSLPADMGEAVARTDREKLVGIFTNLLNNAIKFTDVGDITFGFDMKEGGPHFFVRDTGIGIPGDSLKRIFNRFEQVDNRTSRIHEGSGLGLSIVKAYVELLHGTIWVESKLGSGSCFHFSLPSHVIVQNATTPFQRE